MSTSVLPATTPLSTSTSFFEDSAPQSEMFAIPDNLLEEETSTNVPSFVKPTDQDAEFNWLEDSNIFELPAFPETAPMMMFDQRPFMPVDPWHHASHFHDPHFAYSHVPYPYGAPNFEHFGMVSPTSYPHMHHVPYVPVYPDLSYVPHPIDTTCVPRIGLSSTRYVSPTGVKASATQKDISCSPKKVDQGTEEKVKDQESTRKQLCRAISSSSETECGSVSDCYSTATDVCSPLSLKRNSSSMNVSIDNIEIGKKRRRTSDVKRWTDEEDACLRRAVEKNGAKNWKLIAFEVEGRNHVQCLQRWRKVLEPGLVKGPWSADEDRLLIESVQSHGTTCWTLIAGFIQGRTAKQCRERWNLTLDPSINRGPWSPEEDARLLELHKKHGAAWASFKNFFNNRTENAVKTRYLCLEKAMKRDESIEWTPELKRTLQNLATMYNNDVRKIQKHLPKQLKGISACLIRAQCKITK